MDQTAITLMRENDIPIVVFPLGGDDPSDSGIVGALTGQGPFTTISN